MTRKPWFWIAFVLISAAAGWFAVHSFSQAFPIVTLDLEMDRETALDRALALAEENGWGPAPGSEGFRQAASFGADFEVQSFVELEAGGAEAFTEMMETGLYEAYAWEVRHFAEGVTRETTVRFAPDGKADGFVETLPEDEPGATIPGERARALAESAAASGWEIDFAPYDLVEQAREERPGGRVDHTLVYERTDVTIGDGRYRLRLVVGGDRLTELTPFVEVPEAFQRRYEEMRSANEAISLGGVVGMLAFLLGGLVGLALLLRQRWVLWRAPVTWGLGVSGLMAAAGLNQWPLFWMGYDTAVSATNFTLQQLVLVVAQFLGLALLYTVTFMAAESLSRRAFPDHIRLWNAWSPAVASTPAVLGRTIGGYLLICVFWAYEVGLYFFTRETLGWWNPSEALFHPDTLATYFPWLTSIAVSLQAGFWEECLFRAVPIAGAALLGRRYGHRWAWITGAILLQALVFGAGHASYPAQPAYARLVELILPSIGWGLLYLFFGLLPAIVLHFAIDVSAFAIPLFVSTAPGSWVNQLIVVLLTLAPLWVVLAARLRTGAWRPLPEEGRNRSWIPPDVAPGEEPAPAPEPATGIAPAVQRTIWALGLAGLVAWGLTLSFEGDAPPLEADRAAVARVAEELLAEQGVELPEPWREMPHVEAVTGEQIRFVWQEGGADAYRELLGSFLEPPHWIVRYALFSGDVAERAEEYRVFVGPDGAPYRLHHSLPEGRPGASLSEEEARGLARAEVEERFGVDPAELAEISAVPSQRPERKDWTFTFEDARTYFLETGEARVVVEIAGDRVADAYRHVHVPEEWAREQRDRRTARLVIVIAAWILIVCAIVAGAVMAMVSWSRNRFAWRAALAVLGLLSVLQIVDLANSWPLIVAGFSTAQPFELQLWAVLGVGAVFLLVYAASIAAIVGLAHAWAGDRSGGGEEPRPVPTGLAVAAAVAGLIALASSLAPQAAPVWGSYAAAGTRLPFVQEALEPLATFVQVATLLLLAFAALDRITSGGRRRQALAATGTLLFGFALAGTGSFESITGWALSGAVTGTILALAFFFVTRHDLSLVPLAAGGFLALEALGVGLLGAHPTALPGAITGAILVLAAAVVWQRSLARA